MGCRIIVTISWAIERMDEAGHRALENNIAKTEAALKKGSPHLFLYQFQKNIAVIHKPK